MKKKVLFVVVCAVMLLSATSVSAQDKVYKEALSKMLNLSGAMTTAEMMGPQMISMLKQSSSAPVEFWELLGDKMTQFVKEKLLDLYLPVYYKYFTLEDLNQIIAFYESPVGKKMAASVPAMMPETMQIAQQVGMQMVAEIQKELEAKGYK